MSINIKGGRLNLVFAKITTPIDLIGLNGSNTNEIHEIDGPVLKSWNPAGTLNTLTVITVEKGYLFNAKIDMDLSNVFKPPFSGIVLEDGGEILPE